MPYIHIQTDADGGALREDLADRAPFALDLEAAGFHRYHDRLCLVQVSTARATYVVDPLSVDVEGLLRDPLEDPAVEVVMHGADYDLRLLKRDLDIRLTGLFDTQIAAALLGEQGLGLAALLESKLDVRLSKKHQRADWAQRPLTDEMLEYAANDTRHLLALAAMLKKDLARAARAHWADEEARLLQVTATQDSESDPVDPVTRVKGARDLPPRQVTALRAALGWRDDLARERDRAPFRVIGDPPLVEAVLGPSRRANELADIKGFPRGLARAEGRELLRRLQRVADLPEDELEGYPKHRNTGPGRPPPEVEERMDRLKHARNGAAETLGIDRGTLLPNATLLAIAWEDPRDREALSAVPGVRRWQVEAAGDLLLSALAR